MARGVQVGRPDAMERMPGEEGQDPPRGRGGWPLHKLSGRIILIALRVYFVRP